MKDNSRIRLTKQLAVLTGMLGMIGFISLPGIAKPTVKGADSAETAQTKQTASPSASPAPSDSSTPSTSPSPSASPTTSPDAGSTSSSNLVQVASSDSSFSTLVTAVKAAGLVNTLSNKGPFTIFAPTNQAFAALPKGALTLLLKPQNKKLLQQVLLYHVVSGSLTADQLKSGKLEALGGGLATEVQGSKVIVNNAKVTQANIQASNGVIHAIDRVLLTRELRRTIVSKLNS